MWAKTVNQSNSVLSVAAAGRLKAAVFQGLSHSSGHICVVIHDQNAPSGTIREILHSPRLPGGAGLPQALTRFDAYSHPGNSNQHRHHHNFLLIFCRLVFVRAVQKAQMPEDVKAGI